MTQVDQIAALKGYVQHTGECPRSRVRVPLDPLCEPERVCACGLADLLASLDPAVEGTTKNLESRMDTPNDGKIGGAHEC